MCVPTNSKRKSKPAPPPDTGLSQAPNSGNVIQQTMALPGGLGTIESVSSFNQYTEAPILDSPFGIESQRVKREKARLSIAP